MAVAGGTGWVFLVLPGPFGNSCSSCLVVPLLAGFFNRHKTTRIWEVTAKWVCLPTPFSKHRKTCSIHQVLTLEPESTDRMVGSGRIPGADVPNESWGNWKDAKRSEFFDNELTRKPHLIGTQYSSSDSFNIDR